MITAQEVIDALHLEKHPSEGGYFYETYRSPEIVSSLDRGQRSWSTAIYYLLSDETGVFSEMHRLALDEVFHFYLGDPVEMLHLYPDGRGERVILGTDLVTGMRPQVVVSGGVWQGCRVLGGKYGFALMGTTVAPGFEYSDYESGCRGQLVQAYPQFTEQIAVLTRKL